MKSLRLLRHWLTWLFMAELAFCGAAHASLCSTCAYITGNNTVYAWDTTANTLTNVFTDNAVTDMDSLVFDRNGNIIFDVDGGQVYIYNSTAQTISQLASLGANLGDLALEPSGGSILLSSRNTNTIYRINLTTKVSSVLYSGMRPDGIIYDNTGRLFACLSKTATLQTGQSEIAQLDPVSGAILNQITGLNSADGMTFSTTTLKLYVGSNNRGFYTIPTDLSAATFTSLSGNPVIDGVGTAGNFLYLINWGNQAIQYNLNTNQTTVMSQSIPDADDIAPLSGFGSQAPPPPPSLTSLVPNTTAAGSSAFTLTVNGSNFVNGAIVTWGGANRTTTFVNSTRLTAAISAADVANPTTIQVGVTNPDSQTSNTLPFTITTGGSCTAQNFVGGSVTPASVVLNGAYTMSCDYGTSNSSEIQANPGSGSCTFTGFNGTAAQYACTAGAQTGTFNNSCALLQTNPDQFCARTDPINSLTVTLPPPVLSLLQVIPPASIVAPNGTIAFHVQGYDQNGNPIAVDPSTLVWSLSTPNNSILNASGNYTAGPQPGPNPDIITAQSGAIRGTATVTIQNPGGFQITGITAVPNPVLGSSTTVTVTAVDSNNGVLTYSWSGTGPGPVAFTNPNLSQSAAVFTTTGTYNLTAKVFTTTFPGFPLSATITVNVLQSITRVTVTPPSATIFMNQTASFQAQVLDQFGHVMPNQPVDWAASAGQISRAGSFSPGPGLVNQQVTVTATSQNNPAAIPGHATVQILNIGGPGGSLDISLAHAYPVPWKSTDGVPYVTFTGLASGTDVKIFTIDGRQVRDLSSLNGEDVHWFIDNANLQRVASGVYFYIIHNTASDQRVHGKVVIIK